MLPLRRCRQVFFDAFTVSYSFSIERKSAVTLAAAVASLSALCFVFFVLDESLNISTVVRKRRFGNSRLEIMDRFINETDSCLKRCLAATAQIVFYFCKASGRSFRSLRQTFLCYIYFYTLYRIVVNAASIHLAKFKWLHKRTASFA